MVTSLVSVRTTRPWSKALSAPALAEITAAREQPCRVIREWMRLSTIGLASS